MTTEQVKPWASFGYEPVGAIVNRLLSRYLRAQRKNMLRFFQERNMFALADRMNQIRKSRQGMLAKNRMFQEVLNQYAALSMPPRAEAQGQMEPLQSLRETASEGMAAEASRASEVSVDSLENQKPGADARDIEQVIGLSDSDPTIA